MLTGLRNASQVPEAFLWLLLKNIAEAIYSLETGLIYKAGATESDVKEGWTPLAHLDIKPENIFLKAPADPNSFPRPVLADFGCMIELDDIGRRNKGINGTCSYQAPVSYFPRPLKLISDYSL